MVHCPYFYLFKILIVRFLLITTGILISTVLSAQDSQGHYTLPENSNVTLSDHRIALLADRYNRSHEYHGYRVQIISSSRKEEARKTKSVFISKYPGFAAYEIYQQPFFIIKIGDFLTRLEAEKLHRDIQSDFPESFVLPDLISPLNQYSGNR